jgi:hypothetical protein
MQTGIREPVFGGICCLRLHGMQVPLVLYTTTLHCFVTASFSRDQSACTYCNVLYRIYQWLCQWTAWQRIRHQWKHSAALDQVCSTPLTLEGDDKASSSISRGHGEKWGWIRRTGVGTKWKLFKRSVCVGLDYLFSGFAERNDAPWITSLLSHLGFQK